MSSISSDSMGGPDAFATADSLPSALDRSLIPTGADATSAQRPGEPAEAGTKLSVTLLSVGVCPAAGTDCQT